MLPAVFSRLLRLGSLTLALWLVQPSLLVRADEIDGVEVDARDLQAREAFAAGRYQDAVDLFAKLYATHPHPNYLHNIGRCYQNLGDADRAIASFREFLRQASKISPETRTQVEGYIAEMERLKEEQAPEADAPSPPLAEPDVPVLPAPDITPSSKAITPSIAPVMAEPPATARPTSTPPPPPAESPRWRRPFAFGLLGAGVTSLALGGYYGMRSLHRYKEADEGCPEHQGCAAGALSDRDDAQRYAWVSNVTFVAGAALVATGTVLLFKWSRPKGRGEAPRTALSLRAHAAGMSLRGAF
ncbi:MAG: tetratricopeptide repeat protein [Myxococcales bacterium]